MSKSWVICADERECTCHTICEMCGGIPICDYAAYLLEELQAENERLKVQLQKGENMTYIKCCNGCVPPERSPTCHATCPKYIKEKQEYETLKAAYDKVNRTDLEVYAQRSESIRRAIKSHGRRHK